MCMTKKKAQKNKRKHFYTYDTEVGVLADEHNLRLDVPRTMKLGDHLKMLGAPSLAAMLR